MSASTFGRSQQQVAGSNASRLSYPVVFWAVLGVLMFVFQFYVLGKWVTGPNFVPTEPGPYPISEGQRLYFLTLQIVVPLMALAAVWFWVIKPWRRDGKLPVDGMIALAGSMTFFWDMCMNYTSTALLYNAHLINFGAWANGAWPGWTSPNANLLPEPILVTVPGYLALVVSQAFFVCWLLRRAKERWPNMGMLSIIALIVVGLTCIDSIIEIGLIRSGIYAYPGGIREITLFAGQTYQFPLSEGFLFGGLGIGAMAVLKFFKDDKGQTFAERGIEKLRIGQVAQQWLRFFAVFGFIHGAFFALYMVPNQWLSTHSDPFPTGYPPYMINNMCVFGDQKNECPGPGVSMPRPVNNPF